LSNIIAEIKVVIQMRIKAMKSRSAHPQPVKSQPTYEPRPVKGSVDYAALGKLAIKRFPKVMAKLAE